MTYLLFFLYLLLFIWLLRKIPFFRNSGLTQRQVQIVFLLKVLAGIIYGWIGLLYSTPENPVDTWWLHYQGLKEQTLLHASPGKFVYDLFRNNYSHGFGRFLSSRNSWWNDLHSNLFIKCLALLNEITRGNYFVNVLFFAFATMAGPVGLFRIFHQLYPDRKRLVFAGAFLVPSYLFWTSGIFRDAPVALALGMIIYCFFMGLREKWKIRYVVTILVGLFILLVFRNYLVVVLLPALVGWWIAARSRRNPLFVFAIIFTVYGLLFFCTRYFIPALNFPQMAVEKQEDFFTLIGNSMIRAPKLEATAASFAANAPHALSLLVLRPWPGDAYNGFILLASLETYLLLALFLWWIWKHRKGRTDVFVAFCLFFSLTLFLMIGFTVNFLGAMVRYRSLVLPLLVTPMLGTILLPRKLQNIYK
ncbi:MAG: hypothetical protein EOO08_10465 [Chitinophagaceae bacterium]|nr:MAG: hypothetical protein EOO08_10465 [Chitinophagaceae bacterium]